MLLIIGRHGVDMVHIFRTEVSEPEDSDTNLVDLFLFFFFFH